MLAQSLAEGGVISQEQYEVCKNNARARDWRNLKGNLSSFQEQPSIEKVLDIYIWKPASIPDYFQGAALDRKWN